MDSLVEEETAGGCIGTLACAPLIHAALSFFQRAFKPQRRAEKVEPHEAPRAESRVEKTAQTLRRLPPPQPAAAPAPAAASTRPARGSPLRRSAREALRWLGDPLESRLDRLGYRVEAHYRAEVRASETSTASKKASAQAELPVILVGHQEFPACGQPRRTRPRRRVADGRRGAQQSRQRAALSAVAERLADSPAGRASRRAAHCANNRLGSSPLGKAVRRLSFRRAAAPAAPPPPPARTIPPPRCPQDLVRSSAADGGLSASAPLRPVPPPRSRTCPAAFVAASGASAGGTQGSIEEEGWSGQPQAGGGTAAAVLSSVCAPLCCHEAAVREVAVGEWYFREY